jgi:tetratricopeptide (TPR) repeat protein
MKILRDAEAALKAKQSEEAAALYAKGRAQLKSEEYAIAVNLGALHMSRRDFAAAEEHFREFRPRFAGRPEFELLEGNLAKSRGAWEAAEAHYRQAIKAKPDYGNGHYNLALLLMLLGRWREGWVEHEWRWKSSFVPNPNKILPLSDGDLAAMRRAERITVWPEQGMGDFVNFSGYLRLAAQRWNVRLAARPHIRELADLVVPEIERAPGEFARLRAENHTVVATMSLPLLLEAWDPVPPPRAALDRPQRAAGALYRVAVCWKGNPLHANDADRSLSIDVLGPLLPTGAAVTAIQHGISEEEQRRIASLGWRHEAPSAWTRTRELLAEVDEVITVDTGLAHFAAAHGVRTKLLLSQRPDWRWGTAGGRTPWYDSIEIIRLYIDRAGRPDAGTSSGG